MRFSYHSWIIILFIQCQSHTQNQLPANQYDRPAFREIYDLQDRRQGLELVSWLGHQDSTIRIRAAYALASVQDIQTAPNLLESLQDPSVEVRKASAYALGQLKDTSLQASLIRKLQAEANPEVKAFLLESLGKCSGRSGLEALESWNARYPAEVTGLGWGLYRAGLQGLHSKESVKLALKLINSPQEEARLAAAHYLARTEGLKLDGELKRLLEASREPKPEIRMAIALALGKSGEQAIGTLIDMGLHDPDHRVRVNAIKALCPAAEDPLILKMVPALNDSSDQVKIAAAELFGNCTKSGLWNKDAMDSGMEIAHASRNYRVKAMLWGLALRHESFDGKMLTRLKQEFNKVTDPYKRSHLMGALANKAEGYEFLREVALGEYHPAITTAAMNAMVTLDRNNTSSNPSKRDFLEFYQEAIATYDVALAGIAAMALRDQALQYQDIVGDLNFLDKALQKLTLPRDMETYQELQRTRAFLSGEAIEPVENPYNNAVDWGLVSQIPQGQKMLIRTSKGDIEIELLVDESPGTVAYFWKLVKEGFYQNKAFHRVVPNFVVQGGCPRGDGWGSTDTSIRSELGPRKYQTGSVGVASAGKDTESCQWFITHSPTPHLDGRYTIFAEVRSGMDTMQQLEIGDKILEITSVENDI